MSANTHEKLNLDLNIFRWFWGVYIFVSRYLSLVFRQHLLKLINSLFIFLNQSTNRIIVLFWLWFWLRLNWCLLLWHNMLRYWF